MNVFSSIEDITEVKNKKGIASGVSTIVYNSDNTNKVICLSIDYAKVLYLKSISELINFKFLRVAPYRFENKLQFVLIYEMDLMEEISYEEGLIVESLDLEDIEDILYDSGYYIDFDLINNISNKKHLPACQYDIHPGQFLKDNSNEIICIDPILSTNIYI